ncbi:MAG TPA: hypothetical protein VNS10_06615 [Gemmatimonadaceae bacterium]|nr:hypothetical protein [Gemmatimonadaceae bacterium]
MRPPTVDAVLAVVRAFVLFLVRGLMAQADRTPLRSTLRVASDLPLGEETAHRDQPEPVWTITPERRTTITRDVAGQKQRPRPTHNLLFFRHAVSAESPGAGWMADIDETRDSDQREPARDAGRHYRGRPAR